MHKLKYFNPKECIFICRIKYNAYICNVIQ